MGPTAQRYGLSPHILSQKHRRQECISRPGRDPSRCLSPIAGTLSRIHAKIGQRVQTGDTLARIEAMKLETRILAPAGGVVAEILCELGSQVAAGDTLIRLESDHG